MPLWVTRTRTWLGSAGCGTSPGTKSRGARSTIAFTLSLYTERFRVDRVPWGSTGQHGDHFLGRLALQFDERLFRIEARMRCDDHIVAANERRPDGGLLRHHVQGRARQLAGIERP